MSCVWLVCALLVSVAVVFSVSVVLPSNVSCVWLVSALRTRAVFSVREKRGRQPLASCTLCLHVVHSAELLAALNELHTGVAASYSCLAFFNDPVLCLFLIILTIKAHLTQIHFECLSGSSFFMSRPKISIMSEAIDSHKRGFS